MTEEKVSEASNANAKLIAAAPELLEACKESLKDLKWLKHYIPRHRKIIAQLEQAIAKSERGAGKMKFKDTQGRYESLSARMMKLQSEARSLWHAGKTKEAERIADTIANIADVRLRYIYQ